MIGQDICAISSFWLGEQSDVKSIYGTCACRTAWETRGRKQVKRLSFETCMEEKMKPWTRVFIIEI